MSTADVRLTETVPDDAALDDAVIDEGMPGETSVQQTATWRLRLVAYFGVAAVVMVAVYISRGHWVFDGAMLLAVFFAGVAVMQYMFWRLERPQA